MEQTALRLLKRLKASSASRERVTSLLLLLLAINPKSDCHALIKWLSQSCSEIEARKLIKTILTTHRGPFSFVLNPSIGWMIVIYDENSKSNDFEEIMKVPYLPVTCSDSKPLSSSIETTNHINADIRVGDEIKLTSLPKMWFFVHEIRPQSNSVMLIAVDETKKSRLKGREYKEIYCLSLIGCTVKRRTAVMCEDHYPNSCFCQRITDAPIIFKFPQPDPQTALEALASIVDDECQTFGLFGQEIDEFGSDHVIKMQKASFVETWLEKKKNLVSARKYLHHIHSTLSLSRLHWLAVGRALRVISLGGRDLLDSWKEWSKSCPSFSESDQTINTMWIQFRPPTNADHADILRAREFLEERKRSLIEQYQLQSSDTTISVNLYSDPLARTVLDDANTALQNASLEYWPENMHQSREGNVMVPSPVVVPSALYTASSISAGAEISKTSRYVPLGHFEEMSTCDAVISTGSLISISETGYDYPHSCQVSRQWYYVHRVDLLFARVLVSRCLAPPLPWILSPDDQPTEIKHWIEISKLWHILVCSCRTEQKSQRFQYQIFVAPTPDPLAAVRMLKRLSERSPAHELGTAHATHLKHQARTSSQLNVQNDKSSVIDLDILEQTSSTITLCWCCTGDTDYFLRNEITTTEAIRENIGIVKISIRKSSEQKIFEWEDVYQGKGRGCTIEYLEPNTSYHIRLIPLESSHQRHNIRGPVYISARTEQLENIE